MERFRLTRKGYDRVEVDRYIDELEKRYNTQLTSQMERIDSLKMDVTIKEKELLKYREKESDINEALLQAIDRAKEMDYTAKIRFTLEGERIKIFRSKWINYCNKHRDNLRLQGSRDMLADYLDAMDREIAKVMENDLNIYKETRLTDPEKDYLSETERGFNLDDINNPPDLKSICKELEAGEDKDKR